MIHATEARRCLLTGDVPGMMKVWAYTHPHLATLGPADALIALHIARVEAKSVPKALKLYSLAMLEERGYRKIDGQWVQGQPKDAEIVEAAGLASKSADPRIATRITQAMSDAYLDALAAGIREIPMQKERILNARARQRFKMRLG